MYVFINNTQLYVYKYKHYFHAHINKHISIKVNIIHIFIWIFAYIITFLHGRFVYIHTFFHRQIVCICRLAIYLCDIWHASYERRLHYNHVAPSEPIWATFAFTIGKICPWSIRNVTIHLSIPVVLRRATLLYIRTYLPGKMVTL